MPIASDAPPVDLNFLSGVRDLVTKALPYDEDYTGFRTYQQAEQKGGAKCYDKAQYMGDMLASRGIPADKMKMVVVRIPNYPKAHTVLAVDMDDDGDPYVLDINQPQVLKLSQRQDLAEDVRLDWMPSSER